MKFLVRCMIYDTSLRIKLCPNQRGIAEDTADDSRDSRWHACIKQLSRNLNRRTFMKIHDMLVQWHESRFVKRDKKELRVNVTTHDTRHQGEGKDGKKRFDKKKKGIAVYAGRENDRIVFVRGKNRCHFAR